MRNSRKIITFCNVLLILIGCKEAIEKEPIENEGWKEDSQVLKTIKNVNFSFPDSGFAFDNKEDLINESMR